MWIRTTLPIRNDKILTLIGYTQNIGTNYIQHYRYMVPIFSLR